MSINTQATGIYNNPSPYNLSPELKSNNSDSDIKSLDLTIDIASSSSNQHPTDIHNLLFTTSPASPVNLGPDAKVDDYVKLWKDSFKTNKNFINHIIKPIIRAEGLKNNQTLEHSKAVLIGQKIATYMENNFVTSLTQKTSEVYDCVRKIQKSDKKFPVIQAALHSVHRHSTSAYHEVKNQNHRFKEINAGMLRTFQILSHRTAYNIENEESIEIAVPINGEQVLVNYKVEKLSFFLNFPAYGLKAESNPDAPPILLFPGTRANINKQGMGESIIADLDPLGPGYLFFKINEFVGRWFSTMSIENWLKLNTAEGSQKAITMGHSLGGALATHTTAYYNDYIKEGYTFCAPGVGHFTAQQYNQLKEERAAPPLHNLNSYHDLIPHFGHQRVGDDLTIVSDTRGLAKEEIVESPFEHHKDTSLEFSTLIFEHKVEMIVPSLILSVVLPIFFTIGLVYLTLRTLVFGYENSPHFTYLLSPLFLIAEGISKCAQFIFSSGEANGAPGPSLVPSPV